MFLIVLGMLYIVCLIGNCLECMVWFVRVCVRMLYLILLICFLNIFLDLLFKIDY